MATGLAIDSSDLDILVRDFIPEDQIVINFSKSYIIEEMQALRIGLNSMFALMSNQLIDTA